jgi:glycosyltransferase involved in cell wall biosynthesis
MKYVHVDVVVPARNEQKRIKNTLISLKEQTLKPTEIIVVNDGSTDETAIISRTYADVVINFPYHAESYAGRPELAKVLNEGLKRVPDDCNYVLIIGADHSLHEKYVEEVISRMIKEDVKIASGYIKGEPYHPEMPRGSGRIYNFEFFKKIGFFPVNWGWEAYVLFKAMQMGCKVKCYRDVDAGEVRPTNMSKKKLYYYGKAMRALGYDFRYALGRVVISKRWDMLKGYLSKDTPIYEDVADFVKKWHRRIFWSRVKRIIFHKGRL